MDEITENYNLRSVMNENDQNHKETPRKFYQSEIRTMCTDGDYLVRSGTKKPCVICSLPV